LSEVLETVKPINHDYKAKAGNSIKKTLHIMDIEENLENQYWAHPLKTEENCGLFSLINE
jgi:hypothetical protein